MSEKPELTAYIILTCLSYVWVLPVQILLEIRIDEEKTHIMVTIPAAPG